MIADARHKFPGMHVTCAGCAPQPDCRLPSFRSRSSSIWRLEAAPASAPRASRRLLRASRLLRRFVRRRGAVFAQTVGLGRGTGVGCGVARCFEPICADRRTGRVWGRAARRERHLFRADSGRRGHSARSAAWRSGSASRWLVRFSRPCWFSPSGARSPQPGLAAVIGRAPFRRADTACFAHRISSLSALRCPLAAYRLFVPNRPPPAASLT